MKFYLVRFYRSRTESRFSEVVKLPGYFDAGMIAAWLTYRFGVLICSGWEIEGFSFVPADCVEDYQPVRLEGLDDD